MSVYRATVLRTSGPILSLQSANPRVALRQFTNRSLSCPTGSYKEILRASGEFACDCQSTRIKPSLIATPGTKLSRPTDRPRVFLPAICNGLAVLTCQGKPVDLRLKVLRLPSNVGKYRYSDSLLQLLVVGQDTSITFRPKLIENDTGYL